MKSVKQNGQQGDVLFRKLEVLPDGDRNIVARKQIEVMHGENGHSHVIDDDEAEMIRIGERMLLVLERAVTVKHEEHKPVRLSPGIWEIGRVKEFDWLAGMERPVVD